MKLSKHAGDRSQQRSIPQIVVDLLVDFGVEKKQNGGTSVYFFDKKARKRLAAYAGHLSPLFNEHLDSYVVIDPSDKLVITVGHRLERIWRH